MQQDRSRIHWIALLATLFGLAVVLAPTTALAVPPVVKTVPWVATNPLVPHDTWSGKAITLKGTSDVAGNWTWDFGDGSPVATGNVNDVTRYAIEALHAYTAPTGTMFVAKLTVQNAGGESVTKEYYVQVRDKTLQVEVNVAIDEGLWAMHKAQIRSTSGIPTGNWSAWSGWWGLQAANLNAFFVNGHLETGDASNPYVETVQRGMNYLFTTLLVWPIGPQLLGNPDGNGNGIGITTAQSYQGYQTGMILDAIVASGNKEGVALTGAINVIGRKYKDIAQDIVDWIAWAQYDDPNYGGWRYGSNEFPDNSACQWDAIGLIAAERIWGLIVPPWVKETNKNWLVYSHNAATGTFGYTSTGAGWGYLADTASGLVQMVMDNQGRGDPKWDKAEGWLRANWDSGDPYGPMRYRYLYALFSFTKSMLLHNPPITMFGADKDLDWYADPSLGIARALVDQQYTPAELYPGRWWAKTYGQPDGNHYAFLTAWAIMMLNRTILESGAPVAVIKATPNPAVALQTITLDGSASYHQDSSKSIVSWQWDLNSDGVYEKTGPLVTTSWPAVGSYPVKLLVTDNATPSKTAQDVITVIVSTPPLAPTANPGGPYMFCPGPKWYLDGSQSKNPDEGEHQPGDFPGDTIYGTNQFAWDLNSDGVFGDMYGQAPDVTGLWPLGPLTEKKLIVQLKVCDTTAASFPGSGSPNLCSTASAEVTVKATCPNCTVVTARAKSGKVQLNWTNVGAHHYNIYRGTMVGGPYMKIAEVVSKYMLYLDSGLTNGTTYYYVVRPAQLNGSETCQSGEVAAMPYALY